MRERWKDIKGYENLYQISNLGRVKSMQKFRRHQYRNQYKEGVILKPALTGTKYYFVTLCKDGVHKTHLVHRLVATAFLPNLHRKDDLSHKDGNKLNNNVSNLEWSTRKENIAHAFATGLSKPHHHQINRKKVLVSNASGFFKVFSCVADAAKFIGRSESGVSRVCNGKLHQTGGYNCDFIDEQQD